MAVLVVAAGAAVGAAGRAAVGTTEASSRPREVRHLVRPGDTLWEIAREQIGPQGDPRPVVARIRAANGLGTGPLLAGSVIRVPVTG
jgi:nucleoid-associated protein YgaU